MEEVPVVPSPKIEGQMGPDSFPFELDDSMDPLSALDGVNVEDVISQAEPPPQPSEASLAAAADFWRVAKESGYTAFCDALSFCGLRKELPTLIAAGLTILAPSDAAFAQLPRRTRIDAALVRQILLAHMCSGVSTLAELQEVRCAVALGGQTHAVYAEGEHACVGTGTLKRHDISFEGGVIHEVDSVLVVLHMVRDSHSEQVWKKTLQPPPSMCVVGGANAGTDFEVHGCLLHAATGQLVPEALRGHTRDVGPLGDEQILTFSEIAVLAKPPSLAKRRGEKSDGPNRYRLLFSLWNPTTLSYVSWQSMATPLVVRNSFHMLPLEEKNYRRQQSARSRVRPTASGDEMLLHSPAGLAMTMLPEDFEDGDIGPLPSPSSPWTPLAQAPAEELPSLPFVDRRQPSTASSDDESRSASLSGPSREASHDSTNSTVDFSLSAADFAMALEPAHEPAKQELLGRLLASLERSQAAAAAGAATSGLSVFSTVDEHGLSLAEYVRKMRLAVTGVSSESVDPLGDASELLLQHQELAAMMVSERLSASLERRPDAEELQERNILGPHISATSEAD